MTAEIGFATERMVHTFPTKSLICLIEKFD